MAASQQKKSQGRRQLIEREKLFVDLKALGGLAIVLELATKNI